MQVPFTDNGSAVITRARANAFLPEDDMSGRTRGPRRPPGRDGGGAFRGPTGTDRP